MRTSQLLIVITVCSILVITNISFSQGETLAYLEFRSVMNCWVRLIEMPVDIGGKVMGSSLNLEFYNYCQKMVVPEVQLYLADKGILLVNKNSGSGKFKIEKADYNTVRAKVDLYDAATWKKMGKLLIEGTIDVDPENCKNIGFYFLTFDLRRSGILDVILVVIVEVNYTDGESGPVTFAMPARGVFLVLQNPYNGSEALVKNSSTKLDLYGIDVLVPMINCQEYPSPVTEVGLTEEFKGFIKMTLKQLEIKLKSKKMKLHYKCKENNEVIVCSGGFSSGCDCFSKKVNGAWIMYTCGCTETFGYPCNPCKELPLLGDKDDDDPSNDDCDPANDFGIVRILYSWIFNEHPFEPIK